MSVIVYKEGNSHRVRGVPCQAAHIDPEFLKQYLQGGWCLDPTELYEPGPDMDPDMDPVDTKGMSNKEIRNAAKLMGHELADTARIDTLRRFIENGGNT